MATLGAKLADLAAGRIAIALPIEPRLSQQDGFLHAGVIIAALDSACGYEPPGSAPTNAARRADRLGWASVWECPPGRRLSGDA